MSILGKKMKQILNRKKIFLLNKDCALSFFNLLFLRKKEYNLMQIYTFCLIRQKKNHFFIPRRLFAIKNHNHLKYPIDLLQVVSRKLQAH